MTSATSRRALALIFIFLLFTTVAFSQTTFTQQTYGSPNQPNDLFVADVNGDGKADIVTVQSASNLVNVFLNHGDGTFTDQASAQYLASANPEYVVVADVNGDGKLDIVTGGGCVDGPGLVELLLGNGDGTFQPPIETQLPQQHCVISMGLTKVNSAKWDIAVGTTTNTIDLLLNNGAAPFILGPSIPSPTGLQFMSSSLSSADYNRDGHWDLAANVQLPADEAVYLFLNDGAGHYTPKQVFTGTTATGSSHVLMFGTSTVDVNGDGIADLLIPFSADSTGTTFQGGVIVAVNNGTGAFTHTTLRANARYFPTGKAAEGDLTGDGFHDIIVPAFSAGPSQSADAFVFYRGTSKTTWAGAQYLSVTGNPRPTAAAVGNFNGKLGFAGTTLNDSLVHVFSTGVNTPPPSTCTVSGTAGVQVCSPGINATVTSPVKIVAAAKGGAKPITAMKAYIDGKQVASSAGASLNASVAAAVGTHTLNVNAWNSAGQVFTWQSRFTVH